MTPIVIFTKILLANHQMLIDWCKLNLGEPGWTSSYRRDLLLQCNIGTILLSDKTLLLNKYLQ
jgi:hypothetical protein